MKHFSAPPKAKEICCEEHNYSEHPGRGGEHGAENIKLGRGEPATE